MVYHIGKKDKKLVEKFLKVNKIKKIKLNKIKI
jgi:hypothetical protein